MDAQTVYGWGALRHGDVPTENMGNSNPGPGMTVTHNVPTGFAVGNISTSHGAVYNNPLFIVLVLMLVVTGYLGMGFDFHLKRVGKTSTRIGS